VIISSRKAITCLAAMLLLSSALLAEVTAGIQGTVTDPSGATVPNATVTLKNPDTGLERKVQTDASGSYQFLSLPVGEHYVLQVEAQGFRTSVQNDIKLLVNQKYRADFVLVVGAVSQTVDVSSSTAQVDTSSTQLGDVIEGKKMTGIPLNGRSYIDLLGLQAGVIPVSSDASQHDRFVSGNGNTGQVSVNGQRETANSFMVNGGDVEESVQNGASIVPTLDSIEEFRLLTNSFNAEYGRFSGAIVNVITKSGTNEIHGSAYEFLRNEKLDARAYFDPDRGEFRRNQFGGTIGAPVVKNKLFFFGDYQGTREIRGISSGIINVPSNLERTGDFSDLATTQFSPFTGSVRGDNSPTNFAATLTQRLGYPVTAGEQYWFAGCTTNTACVFPGAAGPVIPVAAWSPVAVKTLQFIPTATGQTGGTPNFSTTSQKTDVHDDKFGVKIDLNKFGNWSFYYHYDDSTFLDPYPGGFPTNVPGFSAITDSRGQLFGVSHTAVINPTTVNELHLNYTRFAFLKDKPVGGLGPITDFGYVQGGLGINPVNPATEGVAPISFGQLGLTFGLPDGTTGQYNNTYQITDNFSKVIGKHTLKFGGDTRYIQVNERNTYTSNGWFQFNGGETGNDFADYLLGAPDLFNQTSHQLLDSRTKYFGLYAQDAFKVRSDLTINYGLRWDVSQPFYDTQGRIQTFVPGVQSKIYPDSPRGFVFPGDPGIPSTLAPTQYNRFAPRLGIAYSPSATDGIAGKIFGGPGKTSIRVGGGLYYTAIEDESLFVEVGDAPFGLFYVSPVPVYLEEPYKNRTTPPSPVGNRFPFTIPPKGATGIWPIYLPVSGSPTYKPSNKLPYAEHFNFTVQRELGKSAVFSIGYVASWGRHLFSQIEANPGSASKCLAVAPPLIAPGSQCGPFGEDTIYSLTNGTQVNGTRPYSVTSGRELANGQLDFSSNSWEATVANSNYNSLQSSLEKKVGDFRFLAAYTWSKSLDNSSGFTDPINPFNPNNSRALSIFDITHNFVLSYGYDLPFFKTAHGFKGKLLGGWNVSGITRFATGFPVTLNESDDASLCGCSGADVPNYNGQGIHYLDLRAPAHQLFDTSVFSPEVIGSMGTSNRRFFHGPGFNNWDFAVHKNTMIGERMSLEFRAELFNIFNHAQFENPGGDVVSSNFGQVTKARDPRIGQLALKFNF
jgi:Carboxypeptidase regulatory-like domain/TonB dependent receptor